jgi:hypothetical protein
VAAAAAAVAMVAVMMAVMMAVAAVKLRACCALMRWPGDI